MFYYIFREPKHKKTKRAPKHRRRTHGILDCIQPPTQEQELIKALIAEDKMLNFDESPPLFVLHVKNYQLLYHAVMLFFTMNLRMSYIYTRGVFYRWCIPMLLFSIWVAYRWRWKCNVVWVFLYTIMFVQNITDLLGDQWFYLPRWFVLYPTVPLVLCAVLENIMFVLSRDRELTKCIKTIENKRDSKRRPTNAIRNTDDVESQPLVETGLSAQTKPNKWKLVFVSLFVDKDVRNLYPASFELYMMACALLLPITGGGIAFRNCITDFYGLLLWVVFVLSEDAKIRSHDKMFKVPSFLAKVTYILYVPAVFWINISILIFMNIIVTADNKWREKNILLTALLLFNVLLYFNTWVLESCPLMFP